MTKDSIWRSWAVAQRCSVKKMFLEIKQNSQENTCVRVSFLIKLQTSALKFWHRCFPMNFAKFLRTPFLKEHHWWLLLKIRLIHFMPLDSFSTPWKLQKNLLSYDVFRGYWKKSVLILYLSTLFAMAGYSCVGVSF